MSQNPILEASGFDRFGNRNPIPNDPAEQVLQPVQKNTQPMTLPELKVAENTVHLWGSGARVKNGAGFFCAPPPSQYPKKNSDYLRLFVDSSFTGLQQLGYGLMTLPMSDQLWFVSTGDSSSDPTTGGHTLMKLIGPKSVGSSTTGIVDLSAVINLLSGGNLVETSGHFNNAGAVYFNTTLNALRWYNGSVWQTIGGGGGGSQPVITHQTRNLATSGAVSFPHNFNGTPKLIRIQANIAGNFSDGSYDGTNQMVMYWGNYQAGLGTTEVFFLTTSGGLNYATVTAVTNASVQMIFNPVGSPTGIADLIITAS